MYLFWLWLALLPQMSDGNKLHMLRLAGNPEDLYHADREALRALSPEEQRWQPLLNKSLTQAETVLRQCKELGIGLIPMNHPAYPELLRAIPDPPLLRVDPPSLRGHLLLCGIQASARSPGSQKTLRNFIPGKLFREALKKLFMKCPKAK